MIAGGPSPVEGGAHLEAISLRLRGLIGLRAALASFQSVLQATSEQAQEPEGRRQLLALWRPCQERIDQVAEAAPKQAGPAAGLRLLRQEVEDSLLDDGYNASALIDLVGAFNQTCEALLLQLERDLRQAAVQLREVAAPEDGGSA